MFTFTISSRLLAGISQSIGTLTPEQKTDSDPVADNRLAVNLITNIETANKAFLVASLATQDKLKATFDKYKAELDEEGKDKSQEEIAKIAHVKTELYKKDMEVINAESEAKPEEEITVELGDDVHTYLKFIFPKTVSQWQKSDEFVKVADIIGA